MVRYQGRKVSSAVGNGKIYTRAATSSITAKVSSSAEAVEMVDGVVTPAYMLPGAYEMPQGQQKKRKCEAGAKKWTKAREAKALEALRNGKEPEVLDPRTEPPAEPMVEG